MKRFFAGAVGLAALLLLASCSFPDREIGGDSMPETSPVPYLEDVAEMTSQPAVAAPSESTAVPSEPMVDTVFVSVLDYIPDMLVDLKYASTDNFTGQAIYGSGEAWLRYGTVKKLMLIQESLKEMGLGLKLWDGFRPPQAQFKLWEICPDPTYVSDPNNGFSNHSRGNTVDITLVDAEGNELMMPTGFDDFSAQADRDYSDCSPETAENARLLEQVMEKHGFKGYYGEWWHYTDTDTYEVEVEFIPY